MDVFYKNITRYYPTHESSKYAVYLNEASDNNNNIYILKKKKILSPIKLYIYLEMKLKLYF